MDASANGECKQMFKKWKLRFSRERPDSYIPLLGEQGPASKAVNLDVAALKTLSWNSATVLKLFIFKTEQKGTRKPSSS